mgnify:CR=1 FL=1
MISFNYFFGIFPRGIIYIGSYSDKVIEKLNTITKKWIIVNNNHFDYDLTTSEGLLKHILPIHYTKLKTAANKMEEVLGDNKQDNILKQWNEIVIKDVYFKYEEEMNC